MTNALHQRDQRVEIAYDVQWSDDGDDNNCFGLLTLAELRTFLTTQFDAGNEVVVTKFCGMLQVGRGRYYKHGDGTFSVSDESPLITGLIQLLKLSERMGPLSQTREAATERPCLSFKKAFLRSVLGEAGGPTQIMNLRREGEARTFIYAQALNEYWYHLTHSGRYINFPKPEYGQALIEALQSYALEQSTPA
ncbi:MAG TPA: hypothetical protein VFV38_45835 [Ktedonobacteraceae bacterium]|nr:hypothetical protein [Ktedonobacteraceae bacterium]